MLGSLKLYRDFYEFLRIIKLDSWDKIQNITIEIFRLKTRNITHNEQGQGQE